MNTMPPFSSPTNQPSAASSSPTLEPKPDPQSKPPKDRSWRSTLARANSISSVVGLLAFVLFVGGGIGFILALTRSQPTPKTPTITTLSEDDIRKLTDIGTDLGTSNQTLNIGANALFRGKADIGGDLSVGGRFNANGPVTLSQLNITGTTALTGLNVGSNLIVGGTTTMQKSLTVNDLATFARGISVTGTASVNALNAGSIAVGNISISGPLTIGHLATQGPTPIASAGTAVGGGGTISISGNDTAGTLNINTGSAPPAGILASVTFRAAYTGNVRVLLSPLTSTAANLPAYVTRTSTGFQVRVDSAPATGSVFAFDYFVTQ